METQPSRRTVVVEKPEPARPGPVSLFRDKVRAPVTMTWTKDHHAKVKRAMRRIGVTRADFIAVLIELYADTVERADIQRIIAARGK